MKTNATLAVVRASFMVDVTENNEQEVFSELCRIVEETIELYQRDGKPLPSATSGKDYANKMLKIA